MTGTRAEIGHPGPALEVRWSNADTVRWIGGVVPDVDEQFTVAEGIGILLVEAVDDDL